jgi:hypothetical protein
VKRRDTFILIGVILAAGTAAFWVGRTVALRQRSLATGVQTGWLENVSPETVQAEQRFEQQTQGLMEAVRAEQSVLVSMLPDSRFTSEQVLAQVNTIAQSYATLARSVGGHVAHLRSTLPDAQRQLLTLSCSNSLRGSMQRRYRWRGGAQDQGQGFMGGRRGGWGRGEGGRGAGYGRQYRGGRSDSMSGLAHRLQLTQEQSTWIQQQDPNFEEQCVLLRDRLYEVHAAFVVSFENAQMTEQELATKLDALIEAHDALEKKVAQHIMLLRSKLSQEQRDLLSGLCRGRPGTDGGHVSAGRNHIGDVMAGLLCEQLLADLL